MEKTQFDISIYVFREADYYVAYCPALDLSTSGTDYIDAVKNFYECLQLYVDSCTAMGTLADDLRAHGWQLKGDTIVPPAFRTLLDKPQMADLLDGGSSFERIVTPMQMPAIA